MDKEKINYFIYARKSTESDGRQVLSIPGQLEDIALLQERFSLQVGQTFTDSASASIPFNRPNYAEMIRRIKKGEAWGIIVWKVDRLARNHLEWGELMHLLQNGIIKSIWTPQREYQTKDSALLIALEASMATQYSRDLAERVYNGLHRKARLGQPPIIAPTGYANTKLNISGTNTIVEDFERWHLMRKAFDLLLTRNYTIEQVAKLMQTNYDFRTRPTRCRPGSPISKSVLHRAFTNIFYTGYFLYKGELYKGKYKPMVTMEEFDTIQEILGRKGKPKRQKHEFAFTGFVKCGSCGCAITATKKLKFNKATGLYKTHVFYHCTKKKGKGVCLEKAYTTEKEMISMIAAEMSKITLLPLWKTFAFEILKEDHQDEVQKQRDLLTNTKNYHHQVKIELDKLLDLLIGSKLAEEKYNEKKSARELLLIRLEERERKIAENINVWLNEVGDKLDFAENGREKFLTGLPSVQKEVALGLGSNWLLQGKKLTFIRHLWFSDLEDIKKHYDKERNRLEPIKTVVEYRKTDSFKAIRPYLSSFRDNVRRSDPRSSPSGNATDNTQYT